jgi:hypothetical protein
MSVQKSSIACSHSSSAISSKEPMDHRFRHQTRTAGGYGVAAGASYRPLPGVHSWWEVKRCCCQLVPCFAVHTPCSYYCLHPLRRFAGYLDIPATNKPDSDDGELVDGAFGVHLKKR